jgi:hypothetical protein
MGIVVLSASTKQMANKRASRRVVFDKRGALSQKRDNNITKNTALGTIT